MYILVFCSMCALGLLLRKSKFVSLILFIYIWAAIGLNTFSPDYFGNSFMYDNIESETYSLYEPGYVLLVRLINYFGMSFASFRCVVAFIGLIFVWLALRKMSHNMNVVLVAMLLYPIILFASGLRSFIGYGIVLYACSCLFSVDQKKILKYIVLVLIAALFHYQYFFFLLLLLFSGQVETGRKIFAFVVEIFIIILYRQGIIYAAVSKIIRNGKVLKWFLFDNMDHPSFLMDIIVCLFFIGVYLLIKNRITIDESSVNENECTLSTWVPNLLTICVYMLPLLFINYTFERLFEIPVTLFLIYLSNNGKNFDEKDELWVLNIRSDIVPIMLALLFNILFPSFIHGGLFIDIIKHNMLW